MGILDKIKSLASAAPQAGPEARMYLVDAMGSDRGKKRRDHMAPGAQVKLLQRLARFTKREALDVGVLLEGKELRVVQHGGEFQGLRVYFQEDPGGVSDSIVDLVRRQKRKGDVTVITDDVNLEDPVRSAGATAMRMGTFRKAWDMSSSGSGSGSGSGSSTSKPNRNGGRRQRSGRSRQPPQEKASVQGGGDTVRDLIDLVE